MDLRWPISAFGCYYKGLLNKTNYINNPMTINLNLESS